MLAGSRETLNAGRTRNGHDEGQKRQEKWGEGGGDRESGHSRKSVQRDQRSWNEPDAAFRVTRMARCTAVWLVPNAAEHGRRQRGAGRANKPGSARLTSAVGTAQVTGRKVERDSVRQQRRALGAALGDADEFEAAKGVPRQRSGVRADETA